MGSESHHKISFSVLPRRLTLDSKQALVLSWDRKALLTRLKFVVGLICENPVDVHFEFLDEVQMGELNWQFRGKDSPTDVLSFPPHHTTSALDESTRGLSARKARQSMGEIAVCVGVCVAQAKRHRCSLAAELERMLIHGLVHLKGFDHERSDAAFSVMSALEKAIRNQLVHHLGEPYFCEMISAAGALKRTRRMR